MPLSITWLGHSTFVLQLPSGIRLVTDPWLGNPKCPEAFSRVEALRPVHLILVSHGHDDHTADVIPLARASGAPVVCVPELGHCFRQKGLHGVRDMGIGGTQEIDGVQITMTAAVHTSSMVVDGRAQDTGAAAGFIIRAPDLPTVYFAGDTGLFGDMKIIAEVYAPQIAFLPIGDHYTMGPDTAARAARWLAVRQVVPMHWGTFPILRGTPGELKRHLAESNIDVLELAPGQTAE